MVKGSLDSYVGHTVRVYTQDTREYVGIMLAHDRHMNFVLKDCK
ncbi:hypothetical protein KIPB_015154, partial [Kipferlia bialata]|eukprot:g15154.t1